MVKTTTKLRWFEDLQRSIRFTITRHHGETFIKTVIEYVINKRKGSIYLYVLIWWRTIYEELQNKCHVGSIFVL